MKAKKFPDLTGDGKTTMADILKGRGVFARGGMMRNYEQGGSAPMTPVDGQVLQDESGREYVLFSKGEGMAPVKVYSDDYGWNEVDGVLERGIQFIRTDITYPVIPDEEFGGFKLDAVRYDAQMSDRSGGMSDDMMMEEEQEQPQMGMRPIR